jgi:hypothetical protein
MDVGEKVCARRDDDETVVAQRARVLGILAKLRSARGNKRMVLVNRDFNAVINIRRWAVLKTRHEELTRSSFVE